MDAAITMVRPLWIVGLSRRLTAAAWPPRPSVRARVSAAGPIAANACSLRPIRLISLTKSVTLIGLAKRAVPPVGMTWLGPAV